MPRTALHDLYCMSSYVEVIDLGKKGVPLVGDQICAADLLLNNALRFGKKLGKKMNQQSEDCAANDKQARDRLLEVESVRVNGNDQW